ncbi:MAG: hypothetical protein ACLQIB_45915 [Isosphaeraceae bacterium]
MLVLLSFGSLFGPDGQSGNALDESLRTAVRVEYPRALKDLEAFYGAAAGEVLATETAPRSKRSPVTTTIYRFASVAPEFASVTMRRLDKQSDQQKMPQAVFCRNKTYSFILQRAPGRAEFSLRQLAKDKKAAAGPLHNNLERYLDAPFSFEHRTVRWVVEQPEFSIRSVAEMARDGKRALSIHFGCPFRDSRQTEYEGKLVVLPDEKWVAVEFEYLWKDKQGAFLHRGEIEYEGASEGFPIPKRVIHSIFKPDNPTPLGVKTYEFSNMRFGPLPEKEFTLSAFGLPEIDAVSRRRAGGMEYWLIGAAILALSIAVMLWKASAWVRSREAI